MSSRKIQSPGHFLAIGSAVLLIQIGGVAAANQRPDIQEQTREVLSGTVAAHAISRTAAAPARKNPAASGADAQAFASRLLRGWSVAAPAAARTLQQPLRMAAGSGKHADIQAMVRRQLRGV